MIDEIEAFQRRHALLLIHGDLDALVGLYRTPLPVFSTDGMHIEATKADLRAQFEEISRWMRASNIQKSEVEVVEIARRDGTETIAVTTRIRYFDAARHLVGTTVIRHFMERRGAHEFVITMIDCKELAFKSAPVRPGSALFH